MIIDPVIFNMIAIAILLILGLAPMLLSIWGIHSLSRYPRLYRGRTQSPRRSSSRSDFQPNTFIPVRRLSLHWLDPVSYVGDTSCRYNAHSPFIRCAVNPAGPCQDCAFYEPSPHLQ